MRDVYIIDLELMFNCTILVLLVEDQDTMTRELSVLNYRTDSFI